MHSVSDELAVLVLAAGRGSRMGDGKLLLDWKGSPLVCRSVGTALAMQPRRPVFVVTGFQGAEVKAALLQHFAPEALHIAENPHWENGQSASLKQGLRAILSSPFGKRVQGVMAMLGDQPIIKSETLDALAARFLDNQSFCQAAAPYHQGKRGNPVILSRSLFDGVMALDGDTGARAILSTLGDRLLRVEVGDEGILLDVDSPDDYDRHRHS